MRILSLLLVITLSTTGCFSSRQARVTGIVTGAALIAGGVAMLADMDPGRDDAEPFDEGQTACALGGCVLAGAAIVTGVAVAILSIALGESSPPPAIAAAPPPPIVATLFPVGPLPQQTADLPTIQMARQARSAAARGDCSVALVMRSEIENRDPSYADALTQNATLGDCR